MSFHDFASCTLCLYLMDSLFPGRHVLIFVSGIYCRSTSLFCLEVSEVASMDHGQETT